MRSYPEEKEDFEELERLNAKPWQVELLKKNPDYPHWGNFEDYMSDGKRWEAPLEFETIDDGGLFDLDDYNFGRFSYPMM